MKSEPHWQKILNPSVNVTCTFTTEMNDNGCECLLRNHGNFFFLLTVYFFVKTVLDGRFYRAPNYSPVHPSKKSGCTMCTQSKNHNLSPVIVSQLTTDVFQIDVTVLNVVKKKRERQHKHSTISVVKEKK